MFVRQGARQFEIWSGKPAPLDEMRGAVLKALEDRRVAESQASAQTGPETASESVPRVVRQKAVKSAAAKNGNRRVVKHVVKKQTATKKKPARVLKAR